MKEGINEGLRQHQTSKSVESQLKILTILSHDEDWHRYIELQEKTKLSTKTLSKQLDKLLELTLIEKDENKSGKYNHTHPTIESGKYPHPVYYSLNPTYVNAFRGYRESPEVIFKDLKLGLLENKNPLEILREINAHNNIVILGFLLFLKENKNTDDRVKRLLLEYLVWNQYKRLTWKLIEESEKVLESIDIKQLISEV